MLRSCSIDSEQNCESDALKSVQDPQVIEIIIGSEPPRIVILRGSQGSLWASLYTTGGSDHALAFGGVYN